MVSLNQFVGEGMARTLHYKTSRTDGQAQNGSIYHFSFMGVKKDCLNQRPVNVEQQEGALPDRKSMIYGRWN